MSSERRTEYCIECRLETEYALKKKMISKTIRNLFRMRSRDEYPWID